MSTTSPHPHQHPHPPLSTTPPSASASPPASAPLSKPRLLLSQIKVLQWRHYLIKSRTPLSSILTILSPVFFPAYFMTIIYFITYCDTHRNDDVCRSPPPGQPTPVPPPGNHTFGLDYHQNHQHLESLMLTFAKWNVNLLMNLASVLVPTDDTLVLDSMGFNMASTDEEGGIPEPFLSIFRLIIGFGLLFTFTSHAQGPLQELVLEKEKKTKDGMLMQGLFLESYWISIFLNSLVQAVIASFCIAYVISPLFEYSSIGIRAAVGDYKEGSGLGELFWKVWGWYYLDNVVPQSSGIPRPWTFPITSIRKYLGLKKADSQQEQHSSSTDHSTDTNQDQNNDNPDIEQDPPNMTPLIKLHNITKRFDSGWNLFGKKEAKKKEEAKQGVTAVDNVSLNFYQGEIFALLGHNGAGKSTLFSILTGVLGMSEGVGEIAGFDIEKDMNSIRQVIGVCPQFDVLYDDLTVLEHLYLFSGLKGLWKTNTPPSLYNLLTSLDTNESPREIE
ncbi:ATP-binding cassette sub- A member 3 [Blyttiomyces sp. JEL0837]|nr:ATP-binding cassette sub- A member 3 [Blyttiomyces sp. JEL0837]